MNYMNKLLFITFFAWCYMPRTVFTSAEFFNQDQSIEDATSMFLNHASGIVEGFHVIGVDLNTFNTKVFSALHNMKLSQAESLDQNNKKDLLFMQLLNEIGLTESSLKFDEEFKKIIHEYLVDDSNEIGSIVYIMTTFAYEKIVCDVKALFVDGIKKNKLSTDPVFVYVKKMVENNEIWFKHGIDGLVDQKFQDQTFVNSPEKELTLLQIVLAYTFPYLQGNRKDQFVRDIIVDQLNKVRILVNCGADIHQVMKFRFDRNSDQFISSLDVALLADSIDDMERFIALGIKVPSHYDHFMSQIIWAHADKILKHELEKGILVDAEWLRDTAYSDNANALRLLLQYPDEDGKLLDVNVLIDGGTPLLTIAARHNALNVMKELLAHKDLDINYMKKSYILPDDDNAYRGAIQHNHMEAAKLLLGHGAIDKTTFLDRIIGSLTDAEMSRYYYSKIKLGAAAATMAAMGYYFSSKK